MERVVWRAPQRVRLQSAAEPAEPGGTDALVRVVLAPIGSQDIAVYGQNDGWMRPGTTLGREAVGVVEAVGPQVDRIRPGQRVVVSTFIPCGSCVSCRTGRHDYCRRPRGGYRDFTALGTQAAMVAVPFAESTLWPVPPDWPDESASLIAEALPTALRSLHEARLEDHSVLAVIGLGLLGRTVAWIAVRRGLRVVGIDHRPNCRRRAEQWGIPTCDFDEDAPNRVVDLLSGRSPDAVIDTIGSAVRANEPVIVLRPDDRSRTGYTPVRYDGLLAIRTGCEMVRPSGTLVLAGPYFSDDDVLPLRSIAEKQLTVSLATSARRDWVRDARRLVDEAGHPPLADLTTKVLPLREAGRAYRLLYVGCADADQIALAP